MVSARLKIGYMDLYQNFEGFLIYFKFIYRVSMTNNGQFTVGHGLDYVMDHYITFKLFKGVDCTLIKILKENEFLKN